MTSRDRRALILGGALVVTAALALRVVPSVIGRAGAAHAALTERAALLARTRDEMSSLPVLRDSAAVLSHALLALATQVLSGSTAAEASADLSGRLNLAAARAPAKLERLDPLPDSLAGGRLGMVRVHAALETDVRGLVALLKSIDAGEEVLRLEESRVEAPDPAMIARGPEILKVEVTVSGWYIKPRDAGNGKRET